MKKSALTFILLLSSVFGLIAQQKIEASDEIFLTGEVEAPLIFSLKELMKLPAISIPDLKITNHLGEPRGELKNMKGVLITTLLQDLNYKAESPRVLSEFYFTFIASDDYKVVFSWNELFNSPTGEHTFLVTEVNGERMDEMEDRILLICNSDLKTGRRHVKSLNRIIVNRVQ